MKLKQKNHRRMGSGLIDFVNESKPDRRAGEQRVRKQQVQVLIHELKLSRFAGRVKWILCVMNG